MWAPSRHMIYISSQVEYGRIRAHYRGHQAHPVNLAPRAHRESPAQKDRKALRAQWALPVLGLKSLAL